MKIIPFDPSAQIENRSCHEPDWRWIASDLLETLKLAETEIHHPGAARAVNKDIGALVQSAIARAERQVSSQRKSTRRP